MILVATLILTLVWSFGFALTVTNAGFENWTSDDADNWTKDTAGGIEDSQESTIKRSGSYSGKLTINTGTQGNCDYYSDLITGVSPSTQYTASIYVYDNDLAGRLSIVIDWYDASDVFISAAYSNIYSTDSTEWQQLQYSATSPSNAAKAVLRLRGYDISDNWDGDAVFYVDDAAFEESAITPTDVANISEARDAASGTLIRITGAVTLVSDYGGLDTYGDQFAIQDSSGTDGQSGIIIVDPTDYISDSTNYTVGYTLTNVTGNRSTYHGMEQLSLTADPGAPSSGSAPSPLVVSLPIADLNAIEAELIRINGLSTTEVGTWTAGTNYTFSDGTNNIVVRIEEGCELVGDAIPSGAVDIMGIAWEYDGTQQIEPRFDSDVVTSSGVADWTMY